MILLTNADRKIELDEKVTAHKKFRQKNPKYIRGNGCVYIGQSARKPEIRFEQHKEGYKANYFAKLYGIKLLLSLFIMRLFGKIEERQLIVQKFQRKIINH